MKRSLHFFFYTLFLVIFLFPEASKAQTCNITGDTVACAGKAVSYSVPSGDQYEWQAFDGNIVGSNSSQTVSVMWPDAGTGELTLVVRDQFGNIICTLSQNIEVVDGPEPIIAPSFISACKADRKGAQDEGKTCLVVCDSSYVTYTTPYHPGSNYDWDVQGAASYDTNGNKVVVFWTGTGQGSVSVTETDANGCVGEAEICVEVTGNPNADFSTSQPLSGGVYQVCLDQEIIFFNDSDPGTGKPLHSFEWIFGDGNSQHVTVPSSDVNQVTHSYSSPGTYQVMLITENECYCKDTAYATIEVSSQPGPDIYCIGTVCPGTPQTYYTSADCPDYNWSVTNGTIISGAGTDTVTVDWNGTAPNILTLDVNGCGGSMCDAPTSIQVPVIPSSVTIEGPEKICQYSCETFRIDCSIPVNSIKWHFPPGVNVLSDSVNTHEVEVCFNSQISGNITVDYQYDLPGSTPEINCGGSSSKPVEVLPEMFMQGKEAYCINDTFKFTINNGGTGQIAWNILDPNGNSVSYTLTNGPVHEVTGAWIWGEGNFTVTAEDTSGVFCNEIVSKSVKISTPPVAPDTILGDPLVCPTQTYSYSAIPQSVSNYIEWEVNNGMPSSATGNTINVTWDASGPYEITAYQINSQTGCTSQGTTLAVNSILPLQPTTINGPDTLCPNAEYNFSTPDPGDQFTWDINPSIAGSIISGQYSDQVTLQTNNYQGTAWLVIETELCGQSRKDSIQLLITSPPAPAISAPATACQGTQVSMTAMAAGATSFTWDFGDGNTGSGSTVNHTYNSPGNHVVVLIAHYTNNCNDSSSSTHSISITPKPNTNISTPDPTEYCQLPISTSMYVASPVTSNTYQWYDNSGSLTSGTSYTTTSPGSFYVIAQNSYGCKDTSNIINVDTINCNANCQPEAHQVDFSRIRQGCNTDSFTANLSNASSPVWDFDDPHATSTIASGNTATHTFPEPGYYRVELCAKVPEVGSSDSCLVCTEKIDTVNYVPDFYDSLYCTNNSDSFEVQLVNNTKILSTAPTPGWSWSVNSNPPFSTDKNPVVTLAPGTYNVTLTVNGVCVVTKTIDIPDVPNAAFTAMDSVCVGAPMGFINNSTGSSLSSTWNFGDGSESLLSNPTRTYDNPGTYTVSLTIENQYGCSDSVSQTVTVMPNTLSDSIVASGPINFCEGDSVQLSSTASGGYPAYSYLWSNLETSSSIAAEQTGNYYVEVTDQLGCRHRSKPLNVIVNNNPQPNIDGPEIICRNTQYDPFTVNYPSGGGYQFQWYLNGSMGSTSNSYFPGFLPLGSYEVVVEVTNPDTCLGRDTLKFEVVGNPNVSVSTTGSLCEGDLNTLVATSNTPGIDDFYWNTGINDDTLQTSVPDNYTVTVIDSNGCEASQIRIIHPLPELCGLVTGCYDICDTVSKLVWHAPAGYASYTWFYNGDTIPGQTTHILSVPPQSGIYTVYVENSAGCGIMSEPIDITLLDCECEPEVNGEVDCGPVNADGQQTYEVTFSINNPLGAGANVNIYSSQGIMTGISSTSLSPGPNMVSGTFTPYSSTDTACFDVVVSSSNQRCLTEICLPLPDCQKSCQTDVKLTRFDCAGFDSAGNPQYYFCMDVNWSGNNGATLTMGTASGTFTTNPVTINSGTQNVCFTYTDLPPTSGSANFDIYIYDTVDNIVCTSKLKVDYKPCKDCSFGTYGLCAKCEKESDGTLTYSIEVTVDNPFSSANVSLVPISSGTYGTVTPGTIGPGLQDISFTYTSSLPVDSIICFKVLLVDNNSEQTCWKRMCVALPDCDAVGFELKTVAKPAFILAPNPARNYVEILSRNVSGRNSLEVKAYDSYGNHIGDYRFQNGEKKRIATYEWAGGIYVLHIYFAGHAPVRKQVVILR